MPRSGKLTTIARPNAAKAKQTAEAMMQPLWKGMAFYRPTHDDRQDSNSLPCFLLGAWRGTIWRNVNGSSPDANGRE